MHTVPFAIDETRMDDSGYTVDTMVTGLLPRNSPIAPNDYLFLFPSVESHVENILSPGWTSRCFKATKFFVTVQCGSC